MYWSPNTHLSTQAATCSYLCCGVVLLSCAFLLYGIYDIKGAGAAVATNSTNSTTTSIPINTTRNIYKQLRLGSFDSKQLSTTTSATITSSASTQLPTTTIRNYRGVRSRNAPTFTVNDLLKRTPRSRKARIRVPNGLGCDSIRDFDECCHVADGRSIPYGGEDCVPSMYAQTFTSGNICEPKCWTEAMCGSGSDQGSRIGTCQASNNYALIGFGWCRPSGCHIQDDSCRTNGFFKDNSSAQECMSTCDVTTTCVGYAISSSSGSVPNRCYVHTTEGVVPSGWNVFAETRFDIVRNSQTPDVQCYKARKSTISPSPTPTPSPSPSPLPQVVVDTIKEGSSMQHNWPIVVVLAILCLWPILCWCCCRRRRSDEKASNGHDESAHMLDNMSGTLEEHDSQCESRGTDQGFFTHPYEYQFTRMAMESMITGTPEKDLANDTFDIENEPHLS